MPVATLESPIFLSPSAFLTNWIKIRSMHDRPFADLQTLTDTITLTMILSVTYYLDLPNATSISYVSHILPTNTKLIVWTLSNINNFTW